MTRHAIHLLVVLMLLAPTPGRAEVVDLPETQIDSAPVVEPELTTTTAQVIDTEVLTGTGLGLEDALEYLPGIHLRRFGAPGSYAALSVRGLGPDNVAVVLDDMPLSSATLGAVDLTLYSPASIERVEVYRGGGPIRFSTPLGGLVRLVTTIPRQEHDFSAHVGAGSFGTRSAHVSASGPGGDFRYALFAGYSHTDGDYRYYDDRNTLYNSDDDRVFERQNNDSDTLSLRLTAETDLDGGATARLTTSGVFRDQGIAGTGAAPLVDVRASQNESQNRLSVRELSFADGLGSASVGLDGLFAMRHFRDPRRNLGRASQIESRLARLGADASALLFESLSHQTEVAPRVSWERYEQRTSGTGPALGSLKLDSRRTLFGVGIEHRAQVSDELLVVPALRIDAAYDEAGENGDRFVRGTNLRFGTAWERDGIRLHGNVGRFFRLPTLLERYGDGGATANANLEIEPENGISGDIGGGWKRRLDKSRTVSMQAALFASEVEDLIVPMLSSATQVEAVNLERTRIAGAELFCSFEGPLWGLDAAYTFTRARDHSDDPTRSGKQPPGIAPHRLDGALRLGPSWVRLIYELSYASTSFLDQGNVRPLPHRLLHHIRAELDTRWGLGARFTVRNVTNQLKENVQLLGGGTAPSMVADFVGYPLAGRSYFLSLLWSD